LGFWWYQGCLRITATSSCEISNTSIATPDISGHRRGSVAGPLDLDHAFVQMHIEGGLDLEHELAQMHMDGSLGLEQPHKRLMVLRTNNCIQDSRDKGRPICSLLSRRRCEEAARTRSTTRYMGPFVLFTTYSTESPRWQCAVDMYPSTQILLALFKRKS
jgi:hypothetical protein